MRKLSPSGVALAVTLALAAGLASAQHLTVRPATAAGTQGSTVTTNTTTGGSNVATAQGTFVTNSDLAVRNDADPNAGTAPGTGNPAASRQPEVMENGTAALGARLTPNNPTAAITGSAAGRSQGQTSSGTLGATSAGVVPGAESVAGIGTNTNVPAPARADTGVVPGIAGGVVVPGIAGVVADPAASANAGGERLGVGISVGGAAGASASATPTPIFNATAAQGAAREARRRARGEEPRIYGIAPRTDRDLTHQMKDDPVIRY